MTNSLFNKLKLLSNTSKHDQHKLSAVVLYKGRPLSFGVNDQTKTHPRIARYSQVKRTHAEMSALFKIKDKSILKNCTIAIYREDKAGNMAMARCCPVCQEILKHYGVTKMVYSTESGWKEECL